MKIKIIVMLCLSILLFNACAVRKNPTIFIDLYHSSYQPKFDSAAYQEYKGKAMIFDSVKITAGNATMLGYYSTDRNVRYTTNYAVGKMSQPLESFLWYALQKSFARAGLQATNDNVAGLPELHLNFTSLDDGEAKFQLQLLRSRKLLVKKDFTVTQSLPPTADPALLESRSYAFIDALATAVLSDPDLKKEMLSSEAK
ncbi:MAG: hypothetical protein EG826_15980 [Deltaproteobacteria bacterium]|nr:hypothetical protein [Deltaproteobacteria bacterium]